MTYVTCDIKTIGLYNINKLTVCFDTKNWANATKILEKVFCMLLL